MAIPALGAGVSGVELRITPNPGWEVAPRLAWALAFVLPTVYLGVYLFHAWALLRYPFGIDQGEGYDAYSAWLVNLGRWIYADNGVYPYFSSNYPPLYSYLASIPMAWVGRSLAAARLVSIVATLGCSALIAWDVWRYRPRAAAAAVLAALLFLSSSYVFHTTPLARVNATALLFALGALITLETARGRRLLIPCALLIAALFTKQMTLDAAAAVALWLVARGRWREAISVAAIVGGVGFLLLAALELLSGGHFLNNVVLGNANPWSAEQALAYYGNFLGLHAAILALASVQTWREARGGALSVFGMYFVASALLAVSAGKWGAGESYFLAPLAAGCVQAGRLLAETSSRSLGRFAASVALIVQGGLLAHGPLAAIIPGVVDRGIQAAELGWTPGDEELQAGRRLQSYAERTGGLVLAEDASFLLATRKPVIGNATHLRNLWEAGIWNRESLVGDLASHRFDYVILDAQLYPPPVLEAIGRHYYLYDQVALRHHGYLVFAAGR